MNKQRRERGRTPNFTAQGSGDPSPSLEDRTVHERRNRAAELGIAGRSKMNKADLVKAIRQSNSKSSKHCLEDLFMFTHQIKSLAAATSLSALLSIPAYSQDVSVDVDDGRTEVRADRQRIDGRRDRDARRSRDAANRNNQQIAKWVMIDQEHIVDLAKFGLQRTKTPEVRELAETIVREHQQLTDRLRGMADANTRPAGSRSADEVERDQERRLESAEEVSEESRETRRDRSDRRRPLENLGNRIEEGVERVAERTERAIEDTRDAVRRELNDGYRPMRDSVAWLDIHRDIAGEVAKTAQRDLENEQGYQFDASFVGMLSASHIQQEATLAVLSKRASGDLASTLDKALQTIRQHKQRADRVMQTIKR